MGVVWDREEATVREVHAAIAAQRGIAYTTVMTTMGRLAEKGILKRIEDQPAYRYQPLVSREQYTHSTVKAVVDWLVTHFGESAVAYFVDRVGEEDEQVMHKLREAIAQKRASS